MMENKAVLITAGVFPLIAGNTPFCVDIDRKLRDLGVLYFVDDDHRTYHCFSDGILFDTAV